MADRRHWVYGLHAVEAMLKRAPERVLELHLAPRDDERARSLKALAGTAGLHTQTSSNEAISRLVGEGVHQGVAAVIRPLAPWTEAELGRLVAQPLQPDTLILVLDGVTDPHNLGACLRSADAAGAQALVIPKDRAAGLDGVARKVAAGAAEVVPVAAVTNLARALEGLKKAGIWVVGADGEADQTLYAADLKRPLALVLGAEGAGLRRLTRDTCDFLVRIPMAGTVASLNVSVAAGVALFEARRQQKSL